MGEVPRNFVSRLPKNLLSTLKEPREYSTFSECLRHVEFGESKIEFDAFTLPHGVGCVSSKFKPETQNADVSIIIT